jgi:hypothetical protein
MSDFKPGLSNPNDGNAMQAGAIGNPGNPEEIGERMGDCEGYCESEVSEIMPSRIMRHGGNLMHRLEMKRARAMAEVAQIDEAIAALKKNPEMLHLLTVLGKIPL